MGEQKLFQPLTREDRITVIIYRIGIVLSTLIISFAAYILYRAISYHYEALIGMKLNILLITLYISIGLSVFFIHLYISKFKKMLKNLYYISLLCLTVLFVSGKGNAANVLAHEFYGPLLLIPISGCLGFITAKEAFCFKLMEGYLIALVMPLYLLLFSIKAITPVGASYGLFLISVMLIFFTFRKVFMPLHYDIGDKSAYI